MAQNDKAAGSLKDWDFYDRHVETDIENESYIGAHSVLIAAGPPQLSQNGEAIGGQIESAESGSPSQEPSGDQKDIVYPIGIVQNVSVNQNRGLQRLFEVGSTRSYFVPGRTAGSINLGRVMFAGRSLLRVLTGFYGVNSVGGAQQETAEPLTGSGASGEKQDLDLSQRPGSNNDFFINLASDLFDRPLGLLFYLKDNDEEAYGQFYLENAFVGSHSFRLGAGSVLVSETAALQWDNMVPIQVQGSGAQAGNV